MTLFLSSAGSSCAWVSFPEREMRRGSRHTKIGSRARSTAQGVCRNGLTQSDALS